MTVGGGQSSSRRWQVFQAVVVENCRFLSAALSAGLSVGPELILLGYRLTSVPSANRGALFNPSPWWLHGFYGVPLEQSLLLCRIVRHPAMIFG
jgi:hypothetical protein